MTSPAYQSSKAKGMELLYSKKKYDAAILQFEKAFSMCNNDDNGKKAELKNLIGCALFLKEDFSGALEEFKIAVNKATRNRHDTNHSTTAVSDLGWMFYRIGKCFHELGEYKYASDYFERSASIFQANSSYLESSQNTNTTMARKIRSTLALSKSKRATRRSRRDNSVRMKEDRNIKQVERLFDTELQVDGDVISSKTSQKEERGVMDCKSVTSCAALGTGSAPSVGDHVDLVCT
jgi:tetratricopeptide (TPR) repeat protein